MLIWVVLIILSILVLTGTIPGAALAISVLVGFVISLLWAMLDF